jgi:uncharacterized protein (DUF1501 family)
MISRRYLIRSGGLALISAGIAPRFLERVAAAEGKKRGKILVAVFQRGAADGLNIVAPFGEEGYYRARPTIAIPPPSKKEGESLIDIDGFFGFHPALAPLVEVYKSGQMAVIHGAGSPDNTRSHFDAQDYMETATPGVKSTRDGWLNRYLNASPDSGATPFRAVSMTVSLPRTLQGKAPAVAMGSIGDFQLRTAGESGQLERAFESMYRSSGSSMLRSTARETFEAMEFLKKTDPQKHRPAHGASYPRSPLGESLRQIAQLIHSGAGVEVAFAETGGWDHHTNEPNQLNQRLHELAQSLSAFHKDLGDRMADIVLVTMSEFGRTVRENGSRGTDHGHANVMFVMGGEVKGGQIYGKWPGLAAEQLYEGRDLALTTDFRDVFAELLVRHMKLKKSGSVFPGYPLEETRFRGFLGRDSG